MQVEDRIKELRRVPASELRANPKNWRLHPEQQKQAMSGILEQIGYADALLARELEDGSLLLIDGHLRAETTPDQEVPVLILDVTEAEADLILATLDPLAAMAGTDASMLGELMAGIEAEDDAVSKMLAGLQAKSEPVVPKEEAPELGETLLGKWEVERGQVWRAGPHRVMCGDSTSAEDVGVLMDGKLAQMVFTDPPYGVGYTGGANNKRQRLSRDGIGDSIYPEAFPLLLQYSKPGAAGYVWHAPGVNSAQVIDSALSAGWEVNAQIVWAKNNANFTRGRYKYKHEPCLYMTKKGESSEWYGPDNENTLWEYPKPSRNNFHPTQKPVELAMRAIQNSSKKNDIVLDLFLGSGSTAVAAEQQGRVCYGMELEPKYMAVILQRLSDAGLTPVIA